MYLIVFLLTEGTFASGFQIRAQNCSRTSRAELMDFLCFGLITFFGLNMSVLLSAENRRYNYVAPRALAPSIDHPT